MERVTGFEPATFSLARRRSSQLNYTRIDLIFSDYSKSDNFVKSLTILKNTVKNHQAHSAQARYLNSTPLGFAQAYPTFSLKTKYLDPLLYTLNYPGVSINNNGLVVF